MGIACSANASFAYLFALFAHKKKKKKTKASVICPFIAPILLCNQRSRLMPSIHFMQPSQSNARKVTKCAELTEG